jgi:hypothetical protein
MENVCSILFRQTVCGWIILKMYLKEIGSMDMKYFEHGNEQNTEHLPSG